MKSSAGEGRCPACRSALWAPDAETIGTRTCPRCGTELWALAGSRGPLFFARRPGQTALGFLASLAAPLYGEPAEKLEAGLRGADDLDLVEFIQEVEEGLRGGAAGGVP
jgi:hypothetical protein